jgi:hypothetical protein
MGHRRVELAAERGGLRRGRAGVVVAKPLPTHRFPPGDPFSSWRSQPLPVTVGPCRLR